jgi:hypothetical protein
MPEFHYQSGNLPEPAEFRRILREASEHYDPVDELLRLEQSLRTREQSHGMSSADFYARFVAGKAGDDPELVGWAARYEAFLRLKTAISESLKLVVALPVAVAS